MEYQTPQEENAQKLANAIKQKDKQKIRNISINIHRDSTALYNAIKQTVKDDDVDTISTVVETFTDCRYMEYPPPGDATPKYVPSSWRLHECAAYYGADQVLSYLVEEGGANLRGRDDAAMLCAIMGESTACLKQCVEEGAQLTRNDYYPLSLAAQSQSTSALEYLIEKLGVPKPGRVDRYTKRYKLILEGVHDIKPTLRSNIIEKYSDFVVLLDGKRIILLGSRPCALLCSANCAFN